MYLAVDVDYRHNGSAVAAGVAFADPQSSAIADTIIRSIAHVEPYRPGRFFERELPCVLSVLEACSVPPHTIFVDGYVTLGANLRDGLGAHLFSVAGPAIRVIGVAKTRYRDTPAETAVLRGTSTKPLYVTSAGMDAGAARQLVRSMHGQHRAPTMLAAADRLCRSYRERFPTPPP